jgi:site-specific DNA-methyltransferase (adenine-specific)
MWLQLKRLIKPKGAIVLFGSEPFSSVLRISNLDWFKYDWIWEKTCPSGMATAAFMPMKYHEIISVFNDGRGCFNKQPMKRMESGMKIVKAYQNNGTTFKKGKTDHQPGAELEEVDANKYDAESKNPGSIIKVASRRPKPRLHPTQKPVALLEYLIKTYTNENEKILDFAMGSGTAGAAAIRTKRKFVGIEMDDKYFEVARNRIEQEIASC